MLRMYRNFRAAGYAARQAFASAKIVEQWDALGGFVADDEDDNGGGATVRLRVVPDDSYEPFDSDCGPRGKTCQRGLTCPYHQLERRALERGDGPFGIIAEYVDDSGNWRHADSCWGFVGYNRVADPVENPYVLDHMTAAIAAAESCFDAVI